MAYSSSSRILKKNISDCLLGSQIKMDPAGTPDELKENDAPELRSDKKTDEIIEPPKPVSLVWRVSSGLYNTTTGAITVTVQVRSGQCSGWVWSVFRLGVVTVQVRCAHCSGWVWSLFRLGVVIVQVRGGHCSGAVGLGVGGVKWVAGKGYDAGSAVVGTTKMVVSKVPVPVPKWKTKPKNE
ncbi:hypothetical protein LSH36_897g00042 [Paralvinella palmiformis]|uniref:Uncharacterized protein n=1 Tax=Paralvinella palmiformis TaxID=53620 RepID=A0AAD9IZ16_9ANNE|nr:hypothetical protein LSH36_897g00042 [Paralvinella palmiformis]